MLCHRQNFFPFMLQACGKVKAVHREVINPNDFSLQIIYILVQADIY